MNKPSIPLWRMGLYSLLFATACGVLIVNIGPVWEPKLILTTTLACVLSWMHGSTHGMRVGHRLVVKRVQGELDDFVEKANKDIEKFKTKINRQVSEGDEWKQGGVAEPEEPNES